MDTNMPVLTPAPQAPQKPQAPPGTCLPRACISRRAADRSRSVPAFFAAVRRAAPIMVWCSGPCMWQKGRAIIFRRMAMGSREVSRRQRPKMVSRPWVWQSEQT